MLFYLYGCFSSILSHFKSCFYFCFSSFSFSIVLLFRKHLVMLNFLISAFSLSIFSQGARIILTFLHVFLFWLPKRHHCKNLLFHLPVLFPLSKCILDKKKVSEIICKFIFFSFCNLNILFLGWVFRQISFHMKCWSKESWKLH